MNLFKDYKMERMMISTLICVIVLFLLGLLFGMSLNKQIPPEKIYLFNNDTTLERINQTALAYNILERETNNQTPYAIYGAVDGDNVVLGIPFWRKGQEFFEDLRLNNT